MNDNGLSVDIGGNKRKSPGLKIVSEDFLFPTKRMALERNGGYQMETSKDSEDDNCVSHYLHCCILQLFAYCWYLHSSGMLETSLQTRMQMSALAFHDVSCDWTV